MSVPPTLLPTLIGDLLRYQGADANDTIFSYLAPYDAALFKVRLDDLMQILAEKPKTGAEKGDKANRMGRAFEDLIKCLFSNSHALKFKANVRTTLAEIDILLTVEPLGNFVPLLKECGSHILGEAKCYPSRGPKAEWVTELKGLADGHGTKTAILFLFCTPRKLIREFRTAIGAYVAAGYAIVPFGMKQLNEVAAGKNCLRVLHDQYVLAKVHDSQLMI